MQTYLARILLIGVCLAAILVASLCLTALTMLGLDQAGLFEQEVFVRRAKMDRELFARLFLAWPLLIFFGLLICSRALRAWLIAERWALLLLVLFALGALCALGDPIHRIRAEGNVIRYWTAGALAVAGLIGLAASLSRAHAVLDRLFGASFGLLLLAAASDELLQFHERAGGEVDGALPTALQMPAQDLVTLGVALLGAIGLIAAFLIWRFLPWARQMLADPRYRQSFLFIALAVISFACAMLLDSFDWALDDLAAQLRGMVMGSSEAAGPRWLGPDDLSQAANSLEELLEYLAALLFLMTMGRLYGVRALGFGPRRRHLISSTSRPVTRPAARR